MIPSLKVHLVGCIRPCSTPTQTSQSCPSHPHPVHSYADMQACGAYSLDDFIKIQAPGWNAAHTALLQVLPPAQAMTEADTAAAIMGLQGAADVTPAGIFQSFTYVPPATLQWAGCIDGCRAERGCILNLLVSPSTSRLGCSAALLPC